MAVPVLGNVGQPFVPHDGGGVHPVLIAGAGRHQTVGGKQHWGGNALKLLLLALPGSAEVSRQMGVLFQPGIPVGGEHLGMGVNADAGVFGLFQQLVQILQVVARDDNEGPLVDVGADPGGYRVAEGIGVGLVQQGHALVVYLSKLHQQGQPFLHGVRLAQLRQPLVEPVGDLLALVAQIAGVMGVSRHAFEAKQ